jgi:hypothetical protein
VAGIVDIHAVPAYGRDYKSKAEVLAAWQAGKDFLVPEQGYISIRDNPTVQVWVRYSRMMKIIRVH